MTRLIAALALNAVRTAFSRMLDLIPCNEITPYFLDPLLDLIPESWQDQYDALEPCWIRGHWGI